MKLVPIFLTVVLFSFCANGNEASPVSSPLAEKVRDVLWINGTHGSLTYQSVHANQPVQIDLSSKNEVETEKEKRVQVTYPEELLRALQKAGV